MVGDEARVREEGERGRRLERVDPGRFHGGVCAGLAEYTGADVAVFRLGAIALVLLGGAGITLYLAAWLLIPERGADRSIAERVWAARHEHPTRAYAAALLALLVIACSPHAIAIGALLVAAFLLWQADSRPVRGEPR
ncbi:MAG TPA: PspC domain-containing protein [Gaiellaceae bacterium]|nr:PspC domain-containing protein [Gaiellaceae bacterium]